MIPESTTITEEGRRMRGRLLWAVATLVGLVALTFAFVFFDRSTVVDGPTGSSYVTTATGLAALHETFERDGRNPVRLQRPLASSELANVDNYLVADVEFGQFADVELTAVSRFVEGGGTALILGVPPRPLVDAFGVDLSWTGSTVGIADVTAPLAHAETLDASRFGAFEPVHNGAVVAATDSADLVVSFSHGDGTVVFVADSSLAHNATVDRADNVDLFGDLLSGRTAFDEYRHGYDDTPSTGLISSAPGNWTGAGILGAVVLILGLVSYGRRFGRTEPTDRRLVPDRSTYIDSVARSLRRAGGDLPDGPLREEVARKLRVPPDADVAEISEAARRLGLGDDELAGIERAGSDQAFALDRTLAKLSNMRGTDR